MLKNTMKTSQFDVKQTNNTMNPLPPESNSSSISIEAAESSIQHLTRSFNRRQRWTEFYNPRRERSLHGGASPPWRANLADLLDSTAAHLITIFLLALDLGVCAVELSAACGRSSKQPAHEMWYHWAGVAILGLLGAKSVMQVVALGGAFWRRGGDVMDAAAVAAALVMEVGLERVGSGLIVVVSMWRVVRVAESAFELGDEEIEGQIAGIQAQFEGIKEVNDGLRRDLGEKERLIKELQDELERTPYGTPL